MILKRCIALLTATVAVGSAVFFAGTSTAETSKLASLQIPDGLATQTKKVNYRLAEFPENFTVKNGEAIFEDSLDREVVLTLNPTLQTEVTNLLEKSNPGYGALVAIDASSGAILAAAGSSRYGVDGKSLLGRATFPAASLFKIITAAAAVETANLRADSIISYHGSPHSLSPATYAPNPLRDRRAMSLADAMGKSCNPVFSRVALRMLEPSHLQVYARNFGFNCSLQTDFPMDRSSFEIGPSDYEVGRTAAGYEGAKISPIHAAALAAAVGNGGELLRPFIIDEVRAADGTKLYQAERKVLGRAVTRNTSLELMDMMLETTRTGTASRHFVNSDILRSAQIAGKTGTLRGDNPEGLYHWFIGVAPAKNPEIAVASLVIDSGGRSPNASGLASRFFENYFLTKSGLPPKEYRPSVSRSPVRYAKRAKHNKKARVSRAIKTVKNSRRRVRA